MLNRRQFLVGAAAVLASATGCTIKPAPPSQPGETVPQGQQKDPWPFRAALLSDPHTVPANSNLAGAINGKFKDAVLDYKAMRPDLWLVNGDITNGGATAEYAAFNKIMAGVAGPDQVLVNTGNHDFYDTEASDEEELRRFREAFGLSVPYSSKVAGGIHFVMLADEQYKTADGPREWAWLTAEQLRWFEQVLAEHRDKFTVVCLHQPLQDTVVWSHGGNDFAGCGQAAQLRAILEQNPQVRVWLSGHTHMGAEVSGNVSRQGRVHFVGLGSTFYQFIPSDAPEAAEYGGFIKNLSVSQSRMLEAWPDRVVIRTRDHINQAWMDELELTIKYG